jgi:hypothetical protein
MNCPLFRSNTKGASSGEGTAHSSEVTRRVLLVEKESRLFRINTKAAISGGGTAHSSEVTQRVLLVEKELPTVHN